MKKQWQWPLYHVIRRALPSASVIRRDWMNMDLVGGSIFLSMAFAAIMALITVGLSAVLWKAPHTHNIQIYGHHPRPGFWILMVSAVPLAFMGVWLASLGLWFGSRSLIKGLWLCVPRRVIPESELKAVEERKRLQEQYEKGLL